MLKSVKLNIMVLFHCKVPCQLDSTLVALLHFPLQIGPLYVAVSMLNKAHDEANIVRKRSHFSQELHHAISAVEMQ